MENQVRHYKEKKNHIWLYITLIFLGIFIFLIYTSFYNPDLPKTLTGNIIKNNNNINFANLIVIEANLGVPENLLINSKMNKLSFRITNPTDLNVGKQKISLDDKTSIIVDNFDGKFIINSKNIKQLSGKGSKIFINGLPIDDISGSDFKISFEDSFGYSFLELNQFSTNSISYLTSGVIGINNNKIIVRLKNENSNINKFQGDLEINRNTLKLRGYADKSITENLIETTSPLK